MKNKIILCITLCTSLLAQDSIVELNQISVTETKQEEQNLTLANSISKKDKNEIDLDQVIYQKDLLITKNITNCNIYNLIIYSSISLTSICSNFKYFLT